MNIKKSTVLTAALAALLVFQACEDSAADSTNEGPLEASLSFVVGGDDGLAKTTSSHVTVNEARILLKSIKFHNEVEGDSLDFKSDPFILDLDLSGGLNEVAVQEIPQGSYHKVSFTMHKPEDSSEVVDPDFYEGESGNQRFSVVVRGQSNGSDFTFKSRRSAKQRINLDPVLVVSDSLTSVNVTLSVDIDSWFHDENGNALDPLNEDDERDIEDAIRRSFRAFEDNNHDGHHGPGHD